MGVGPVQPNRGDPAHARLLHDARLAAQVAHAVASPALASALSYLKLVADNELACAVAQALSSVTAKHQERLFVNAHQGIIDLSGLVVIVLLYVMINVVHRAANM